MEGSVLQLEGGAVAQPKGIQLGWQLDCIMGGGN